MKQQKQQLSWLTWIVRYRLSAAKSLRAALIFDSIFIPVVAITEVFTGLIIWAIVMMVLWLIMVASAIVLTRAIRAEAKQEAQDATASLPGKD